jgi:circadian clock protein KaiB
MSSRASKPQATQEIIQLRLYIAGMTPRSRAAMNNLQRLCADHISEQVEVEVIDLLEQPQLAEGDQIFAVPTLVWRLPLPVRKIIGDLSDSEKTLVGLDIQPRKD